MPTANDSQSTELSQSQIAENSHAADANELKRIELQMACGFITRRGVCIIAGVSPNTVALWESRGLKFFKPGTNSRCTLAAFQEFNAKDETFPAVRIKRRKKK